MYRTIVVGTDGSHPSLAAVEAAGEVAARFGADELHVVCGYRPISPAEMLEFAHEIPDEFKRSLLADGPCANIAADAEIHLGPIGVTVMRHSIAASGAEAILDVAAEVGADLIVVGSHGHGVGRRLLRGSVSNKVAHHAPCSVLVVQTPVGDGEDAR